MGTPLYTAARLASVDGVVLLAPFLGTPRTRPARPLREGHRLLAQHLPPQRGVVDEGGHDWETWTSLWRQILDRHPFATEIGDEH